MNNCSIVAEIGINHNGDISLAKSLIDLANNFGCNYVKFQKKEPDICVPQQQKDIVVNTPFGTPMKYIDYKKRMELSVDDYREIDKHCILNNIQWYASVWDTISLKFISEFDIPFIKIPSAKLTDISLLTKAKHIGKPIIISTGMSTKQDIDKAIEILGDGIKYVLHTTSSYPTPNSEMNMKKMLYLKQLYGNKYKIGFSNHCQDIIYLIQAYILGAEMLEFHITLDRNLPGTDQLASVGPTGFKKIMNHLNNIAIGYGDGEMKIQNSEYSIIEKLRGK